MTTTLFILGAMTSLGCGYNVMKAGPTTGLHELAWVIGGLGGAGMMAIAIAFDRGLV